MESIFGKGILEHCQKNTGDQNVNGVKIPAGLAEVDCTPSLLKLYDPSMKEFLIGSAKFRAILDTYPVVPLGELPSWSVGFDRAGEKDRINLQKPEG